MKILIIANRQNGFFNASLFEREKCLTFDMLEAAFENEPRITHNNYNTINRGVIVGNSFDEIETEMRDIGYKQCDFCGEWCSPQDCRSGTSVWDSAIQKRYCPQCYERTHNNSRLILLNEYHSTSHLASVINGEGENYTLDNVKGIGIEMEVNTSVNGVVRNGKINCTEAFFDLVKPHCRKKYFRLEKDCTVLYEIISNVFTEKSLLDFDWEILTNQLKLSHNDERITRVGFHVHLSKLWLGDDPKTQVLNFLKFQYFLKSYELDWKKISGRNLENSRDFDYCQFYSLGQVNELKDNLKDMVNNHPDYNPWGVVSCSHGDALISSRNTIELRIGKSTNDPVKIKHYLALLLGIVKNLANVPFEKIYCLRKVLRLVPQETLNYWRSKGCFLTTNATENRGVSL